MAEDLMLKLFLDTLMRFALENPNLLTPYTQEMADEMDELLAGVIVDEDL
jgi:antitoxin PrlF